MIRKWIIPILLTHIFISVPLLSGCSDKSESSEPNTYSLFEDGNDLSYPEKDITADNIPEPDKETSADIENATKEVIDTVDESKNDTTKTVETEEKHIDTLEAIPGEEWVTKYNDKTFRMKIDISELGPVRAYAEGDNDYHYHIYNDDIDVIYFLETDSNFQAKEDDTIYDIVSSRNKKFKDSTDLMMSSEGLPYYVEYNGEVGGDYLYMIHIPIYNDYQNYYITNLCILFEGAFNKNNKKVLDCLLSNCTPDHYELTDKDGNILPKMKIK